jgi:hypothetical protein
MLLRESFASRSNVARKIAHSICHVSGTPATSAAVSKTKDSLLGSAMGRQQERDGFSSNRSPALSYYSGIRSWQELPIPYAEFGASHDAQMFCREHDVEDEVARFIAMLGEVRRDLGFLDYEVAPATTRPRTDRRRSSAMPRGLAPQINSREGAFYGPKTASLSGRDSESKCVIPRTCGRAKGRIMPCAAMCVQHQA